MKAASGMRLMMTTDAVGGVWSFSSALAGKLAEAGVNVLLVSLGPTPSPAQRELLSRHPGISLVETDLLLEWRDPGASDLKRADAVLSAIARGFSPDIIHFNGYREATLDWNVPTVVVAHSCVNSWAAACRQSHQFGGSEWRVYTSNVRQGLCAADAWTAPTCSFRDVIARHYDLPNRGEAILNGVDFFRRSDAEKLPCILGAGRVWDKAKNIFALATIATAADWPIRIAGPSEMDGTSPNEPPGDCEYLGEISHRELLRE